MQLTLGLRWVLGIGQPDGPAVFQGLLFQVFSCELVVALLCAAPAQGDEVTQLLPAFFVAHKKGQLRSLFEMKLRPMNNGQSHGLSCQMGPHTARDTGLIGNGQCLVAQQLGPCDQVFGMRAPELKVKVARADQFGVIHGMRDQR